MLKRHGSRVGSLDDVVELILERLPVGLLLRFKSVSKKWKSTIESSYFKERQWIRRRQSGGSDILYVICDYIEDERRTTSVLGSSTIHTVKFPTSNMRVCHGSCDGLVCLFCINTPNIVANPATGWHQSFPLSNVQKLLSIMSNTNNGVSAPSPQLGFGKDKFTGTYKPVWLFNSYELRLDKDSTTTCEVFDFSINAWRYVFPASPYRILDYKSLCILMGQFIG